MTNDAEQLFMNLMAIHIYICVYTNKIWEVHVQVFGFLIFFYCLSFIFWINKISLQIQELSGLSNILPNYGLHFCTLNGVLWWQKVTHFDEIILVFVTFLRKWCTHKIFCYFIFSGSIMVLAFTFRSVIQLKLTLYGVR